MMLGQGSPNPRDQKIKATCRPKWAGKRAKSSFRIISQRYIDLELDLVELEQPREDFTLNVRSKLVQDICHEGGDTRVARETDNESGC